MNIDDITAKVKKFSMETVAEVQKMNEVRGLSSQVNAQKKMIQAMYTEMGKKLYDKYKEAPLEGFEPDFHSLDKAFENIEELQKQIRLTKGVTLCPNCKMEVGLDERFCSNCGCKMPEVFRIVEDEPEDAQEEIVSGSEEEGQAEDASTGDVPVEDIPAEEALAEDVPVEDVPAETVPTEDASAGDVPAEDVSAENMPEEDLDAAQQKSETAPEQPEI